MDLKKGEGIELLLQLAAESDVFVENFLPGKLASMGLGYEDLKAVNPGIVYCSISGFGQSGPYSSLPGYDVIIAGIGGMMSITGEEGKGAEPVKCGVAITDVVTGLHAQGAITAALLRRDASGTGTGHGCWIDCSLLDAQVASLVNIGQNHLVSSEATGRRWGTAHESIVPYQAFRAGGGGQARKPRDSKTHGDSNIGVGEGGGGGEEEGEDWLVLGALNNTQFKSLCVALELPELAADEERFGTNPARVKNRKALVCALQKRLRDHPSSHWVALLRKAHIPCGPINSVRAVLEDEHVTARGMAIGAAVRGSAGDDIGRHLEEGAPPYLLNNPVKYSREGYASASRRPPPLLGEHTVEVLAEVLGQTKEEIEALRVRSVLQLVRTCL